MKKPSSNKSLSKDFTDIMTKMILNINKEELLLINGRLNKLEEQVSALVKNLNGGKFEL